jgi:putative pyruvate formate lyase activating enzyme
MNKSKPGYINLFEADELNKRVKLLKERLKECIICPHHCKINRLENKQGFCRAGNDIVIASYGPHYGEEDVLVGRNGSGTVFFSYCTLNVYSVRTVI